MGSLILINDVSNDGSYSRYEELGSVGTPGQGCQLPGFIGLRPLPRLRKAERSLDRAALSSTELPNQPPVSSGTWSDHHQKTAYVQLLTKDVLTQLNVPGERRPVPGDWAAQHRGLQATRDDYTVSVEGTPHHITTQRHLAHYINNSTNHEQESTSRYKSFQHNQHPYRYPDNNRRAVAHQARTPRLVGGSSLFNGG
ncbi:unnamed protein product [Spodoptera exigua]|nr:unnamed protein product [Spodoptera exigua]